MSDHAFKLVETKPAPDTLRFERRSVPRRRISGEATVVCTREDDDNRQRKITKLALRDVSAQGMGAVCRDELLPGTRVAILMPPHGVENGFDLFGRVIRCERCDAGYEIGIALDELLSAVA